MGVKQEDRSPYEPPSVTSEPLEMMAGFGGSGAAIVFSGPFRENPDDEEGSSGSGG